MTTVRWAEADRLVRLGDVLDALHDLRDEANGEGPLYDGEWQPDKKRHGKSKPARVQGYIVELIDYAIQEMQTMEDAR